MSTTTEPFDLTDYGDLAVMAVAAIGVHPRVFIDPADALALYNEVKRLQADNERLRAAGKKLVAELSGWTHNDECQRDGHGDCCADEREPAGWYCEQGDPREDCETRECECGRDKCEALADELAGLVAPSHAKDGVQ